LCVINFQKKTLFDELFVMIAVKKYEIIDYQLFKKQNENKSVA